MISLLTDVKESMERAGSVMRKASDTIDALRAEIARLQRTNKRMKDALFEIEERAQDNYDGPEDRTHGPYLALAQQGLGITP